MTKEELEKEANKYADEHAFRVPYDGSNKFYDDVDFKASKEGYLAGAKPREKRIAKLEKENAELKAQIEKMKTDYEQLLDEKLGLEDRLAESRECYYGDKRKMTKEELRQKLNNEASLYCQEYATLETYDSVHKAYIFSAEPREKRIAELEKQIAEYKEVFGSCDTCKRTCDIGNCCDPRTKNGYLLDKVKVIVERQKLLKENTELKKRNLNAQDAVTMQMYTNRANKEIANKQLTKAKEIIDSFLDFESSCQERGIYISDEIREKANKFLEEE